jgi:hypothetical protein
MTTPTLLHAPLAALTGRDTNIGDDGTLWSHAATLGTFFYGEAEFTLDAEMLQSFVGNFAAGYPKKVPVDYNHETTRKDVNRALVPFTRRAGEVVEVAAVTDPAQLNAAMQKQVADETARRAKLGGPRALETVDPLGLWVRWQPTPNALAMVRDGEITEMSVTFFHDYPHNETGEGQGPTLVAVALTNTPFLDSMIPVAASRGAGGDPAVPGEESPTMSTPNNRFATALAVLLGREFDTDDEAVTAAKTKVTELTREVDAAKPKVQFATALSAELEESDPAKAVAAIRTLKASAKKATELEQKSKTEATAAKVEAVLLKHEKRIPSVKAREMYAANLSRDLEAGQDLGKTDTEAVLATIPESAQLVRKSASDNGAEVTFDRQLDARIEELMAKEKVPYDQALIRASDELTPKRG